MPQHDFDIANQSAAALRADVNNALLALVTNNSGATAPSPTFAHQWWADTTAGVLKQRNAANTAWVSILDLATGTPLVGAQAMAPVITAGTSTAYTLTPTPAITAYTAGQTFWVTFHTASGASPTLQISGIATPPNLVRYDSTGALVNIAANEIPTNFRTRVTLISATQALVEELPPPSASSLLRSYLAGLTMSTAGASTTMTIAAGQAADSTNAVMMSLAASINKTTSAWAVGSGNGGLDTGAIANNTWYHFYLIRRPDTGVVDVLFSLSASSPTLPTNYTQFRRIGSGRTSASAQWIRFFQDGDLFQWDAMVQGLDVATTNPGTAAVLATLTTPPGVKTEALLNVLVNDSSSGPAIYLSDPQTTDLAPAGAAAPLYQTINAAANVTGAAQVRVQTNTSSQVRYRVTSSGASTVVRICTLGWRDTRGKDL